MEIAISHFFFVLWDRQRNHLLTTMWRFLNSTSIFLCGYILLDICLSFHPISYTTTTTTKTLSQNFGICYMNLFSPFSFFKSLVDADIKTPRTWSIYHRWRRRVNSMWIQQFQQYQDQQFLFLIILVSFRFFLFLLGF